MDVERGGRDSQPPRFEGEDATPTTESELRGWYIYGIAAEVFAVCGVGAFRSVSVYASILSWLIDKSLLFFGLFIGSFLPLTLEQLAREGGVLWNDRATSCIAPKLSATVTSSATSTAVNGTVSAMKFLARAPDVDPDRCVVQFFGRGVNTASFAMFIFSAAVLFQALTLVSTSSLADHGSYKMLSAERNGLIRALDADIQANHPSNTSGTASLGTEHLRSQSELELDACIGDYGHRNSANASSRDEAKTSSAAPDMQLSTDISSKGVGLGYIAAVFMQVVSIVVLFLLSKTSVAKAAQSLPMRIVLFNVGVWWAVGTYLSCKWLRHRPGPPLDQSTKHQGKIRSYLTLIKTAWLQLWDTTKMAAKLPQMVIFLIAWFLLSDSIATVSSTAILFAKNELKMTTVQIALMSITSISSGIAGAFAWPKLAIRYNWTSVRTIVVCVICLELVPLYGMLGYIPFIKRLGVIGLQELWEIYPMAFIHGFVLGGLSSYCRSFYGQLIPPGHEAAFYALYAFTDKGSSVIGPAIVGAVVDATGAIRMGFTFLSVLIVLPIPFLMNIKPEEGRANALAMAQRLKHIHSAARGSQSFEESERLLSEQRF
ncbi:Autophagy protein 22 [Ascosphaera aggregata]|nr:Autophagy protein 22 [Ascosphaera aggregata]